MDHFADRLRAAPQSRLQRGAAADQVMVAGNDLALVLADEAGLAEAVALVEEAQKRAGV